MKPKAVTEANVRLVRARAAVATLETRVFDPAVLEPAWWAFLVAAGGIYVKLEKGAKGHKQSEAWFARVKHLRRKDELLAYIHHARNTEEHGLENSTAPKKSLSGKAFSPGTEVDHDKEGTIVGIRAKAGQPFEVQLILPGIKLLPVTDDRFGDVFQPPTTHLGAALQLGTPLEVAQAGLKYLETLVAEAAALV
jgi:hypothetical protein